MHAFKCRKIALPMLPCDRLICAKKKKSFTFNINNKRLLINFILVFNIYIHLHSFFLNLEVNQTNMIKFNMIITL